MDAQSIVTLCVFLGGMIMAGFVRTWTMIGKLTKRIVALEQVIAICFKKEE